MMAKTRLLVWNRPIDVAAAGWALSAALVILFVICALVGMMLPQFSLSHGWLTLFSTAPFGSAKSFIEGILGSVAFGWVTAVVGGLVYNRYVAR
jgi:2TM family of unknown function (DUF5676)